MFYEIYDKIRSLRKTNVSESYDNFYSYSFGPNDKYFPDLTSELF